MLNAFRLPGCYRLCRFFPKASSMRTVFDTLNIRQNVRSGPTTPQLQRLPAITQLWFGLFRFRSPLLTESLLVSLPVGTEMFHFPTFPLTALYIQAEVTGLCPQLGFPIQTSPGNSVWLATPRGLSQPPTSFIGSRCQGIHRMHLITYSQSKLLMLASTVQFSNDDRATCRLGAYQAFLAVHPKQISVSASR